MCPKGRGQHLNIPKIVQCIELNLLQTSLIRRLYLFLQSKSYIGDAAPINIYFGLFEPCIFVVTNKLKCAHEKNY